MRMLDGSFILLPLPEVMYPSRPMGIIEPLLLILGCLPLAIPLPIDPGVIMGEAPCKAAFPCKDSSPSGAQSLRLGVVEAAGPPVGPPGIMPEDVPAGGLPPDGLPPDAPPPGAPAPG